MSFAKIFLSVNLFFILVSTSLISAQRIPGGPDPFYGGSHVGKEIINILDLVRYTSSAEGISFDRFAYIENKEYFYFGGQFTTAGIMGRVLLIERHFYYLLIYGVPLVAFFGLFRLFVSIRKKMNSKNSLPSLTN